MLVLERQNADDFNDKPGVLILRHALQNLAIDDDMRALVDSVGQFAQADELQIVRSQALQALRRRIHVLGLVQYQYRHRIDAVVARKFTKMHVPGEIVPHLQPKAGTTADDAAGKHDAEADTDNEAHLTHLSLSSIHPKSAPSAAPC